MRFQITFFILILIFTMFLTGCPSAETPNSNTNVANNAAAPNSNSELIPQKKADAPTTNDAPTIRPTVKAYYEALKKKDDAALRKVLTAEFIKRQEEFMKDDEKKWTSLAAFMADTDKTEPPVEVRNEVIKGDIATAELKGGAYVNWTAFEFAKVDGVWKFTGNPPDLKSVKDSASNSNTAK